jgi:hypothetical protein
MQTIAAPSTTNDIRPSAVAWIDDDHALVATILASGTVLVEEIEPRPGLAGPDTTYLARVVDAVGDRERIAILGPGAGRLALEREYVLIYRTPDRLIDVEPSKAATRAELVNRVRLLSST